jgi:hypothetical protein
MRWVVLLAIWLAAGPNDSRGYIVNVGLENAHPVTRFFTDFPAIGCYFVLSIMQLAGVL